jgi:hypothetical protein
MVESIIGHVPYVDNPADIYTKVAPGGKKQNHLIRLLLHGLCDGAACMIIPLSERFAGLGGFFVALATHYIIRLVEFACALCPSNLRMFQS